MKRLMRKATSSTEKVPGAAAISCSRLATCAANAPTNARNSSQNTSVSTTRFKPSMPGNQRQKTRGPRSSRLHRGDDRRHDLEKVPDDAVISDLEDRGVGILVDGDNRVRALHPDEVLNGAGDAERDIQLRRDRLPRAADLPLHGQPSGVADRPRRRELGAECRREL